jgi:hypothetical protein
MTPCSPLKANRRFTAICCHHLEGRRISQPRNQREAGKQQSQSRLISNGILGIVSQNIELFNNLFSLIMLTDSFRTLLPSVYCKMKVLYKYENISTCIITN